MTTRFSLAELGDMLHVPVHVVRTAVDELAAAGELTAESFLYQERNWRIAPSDIKRIQQWIADAVALGRIDLAPPVRRIKRKQVIADEEE